MSKSRLERVEDLARRVSRSRLLGTVLAAVALWFAVTTWERPEVDLSAGTMTLALVGSALLYAGALLSLSASLGRLWVSGLASQLLKYVPGTIWQAQPTMAAGGWDAMGRLVAATVVGALLAVSCAGGWVTAAGLVATAIALAAVAKIRGNRAAALTLAAGATAAVLLGASGAVIGFAVGAGGFEWARAVAAGWGAGVLALPVPAGLGVREAVFAVMGPVETGAVVAAAHRTATVAIDVVVGGTALWIHHRAR